jgi:hypothetical protein
MAAIPSIEEEDARCPNREREKLVRERRRKPHEGHSCSLWYSLLPADSAVRGRGKARSSTNGGTLFAPAFAALVRRSGQPGETGDCPAVAQIAGEDLVDQYVCRLDADAHYPGYQSHHRLRALIQNEMALFLRMLPRYVRGPQGPRKVLLDGPTATYSTAAARRGCGS